MNYSQTEPKYVEGYLKKQKRRMKKGQLTSWRFFKFSLVDNDRCLTIKIKQEDMSALKTYKAKQIKGFIDKLSSDENISGLNNSFSFKIITTVKSYILCASNEEEFQSWIKVLQKFVNGNINQVNNKNPINNNFTSKYKIPTQNTQEINKNNQLDFQGLQVTPPNSQNSNTSQKNNPQLTSKNSNRQIIQNSSSYSNSNSSNNDKKNPTLNSNKKKENVYGNKNFNKDWDDDDIDSDEEKDKMEPINNKQPGNFGTFGNNTSGMTSNSNSSKINSYSLQDNNSGYIKHEDKVKLYDSRLKKLNEIPFESNEKSNSFNSPNSSNSYGRHPNPKIEKMNINTSNEVNMNINFKNNNTSVNSSLANNSLTSEERKISLKEKRVINNNNNSIYNNSSAKNLINNNHTNYQPNVSKLEITGNTKKIQINPNLVFEGIILGNDEKGLMPNPITIENIRPVTPALSAIKTNTPSNTNNLTSNQIINNTNNINPTLQPSEPQLITKEAITTQIKKIHKNFIVEFSNQDCFETSLGLAGSNKKENEFETIRTKQNLSSGNILNPNNSDSRMKFPSNDNPINMSRQSQQNDKYISSPDESVKSSSKSNTNTNIQDNIIKNQVDSKTSSKAINSIIYNKPDIKANGENKYLNENVNINNNLTNMNNIPQSISNRKAIEDLQTDFPKINIKTDLNRDKQTLQLRNNENKKQIKVAIFDENLMHIKQGIPSPKLAVENLNFCPINNYRKEEKEREKKSEPQKKILPRRHQEQVKEEFKFDMPPKESEELLQLRIPIDNKLKDNQFTGNHNMIKKILGSKNQTQLIKEKKKNKSNSTIDINKKLNKISSNTNEYEFGNGKIISEAGSNDMHKSPLEYLGSNKKTKKISIDKFEIKKDLNHMSVQKTFQLNSTTVLADEFHMPMDSVMNFKQKQTQVNDYNDQSRNNLYLSNIHPDSSSIAGGFVDMDSDKFILDEINNLDTMNNLSYSLLDAEEEWDVHNK